MKVVIVFRERSDKAREAFEWIGQFERRTGKTVEMIDPETPEGETFASARDIVEYPTVLAVSDDGKIYEMWTGSPMPTVDTVMAYMV